MRKGSTKGFSHGGALIASRVRTASESRGFAVSRVLTHWQDIVGPELASSTRPVKVTYTRQSFGATLVVLTTGAQAPMIEMQKEMLRERVNAIYGYNAIAKISITQTAPEGFAEGQAKFGYPTSEIEALSQHPTPAKACSDVARAQIRPITDQSLRDALETLGANIASRPKQTSRKAEK